MPAADRFALSGATALVTGATGGIGQAIARALAAEGTALVLTGRRRDELERLAGDLEARPLVADLAQRAEVDRLAAEADAVDILIANAALPASGLLLDLGQDDIDRMLEINLRAPIALARGLMPGMIARRRGHLVFIASLSGKAANPASAIYSATKFGLRGFALSLREDLRPHGVGVSLVSPGFVSDAGMFAKAGVKLPPGVGTRTPERVAAAVLEAIVHNRSEIAVAPLPLRLGATIASVAPELAAWGARLMGSHRIAREMAEGQRGER